MFQIIDSLKNRKLHEGSEIRICYQVRDTFTDQLLASFLHDGAGCCDAKAFSRSLNEGQEVPRFTVERSIIVGGRAV